MAKKNKTLSELTTFTFQPTPELSLLLQEARQNFSKISQQPNIDAQLEDLKLNIQLLQNSPLLRLQTQRLTQNQALDFENFKEIFFEQLLITKANQFKLDAHFLAPKFANADLTRYRLYILQLLFLNLKHMPLQTTFNEAHTHFVQWVNGIERAQTTAKVTMRTQPDIGSDILVELPKHAVVNVYQDENPYWKKVCVVQNEQDLLGFVMSAYLKF